MSVSEIQRILDSQKAPTEDTRLSAEEMLIVLGIAAATPDKGRSTKAATDAAVASWASCILKYFQGGGKFDAAAIQRAFDASQVKT